MAYWRDDNRVLSHKIASLEAKLLKALSQEGTGNKSQGQNNATTQNLEQLNTVTNWLCNNTFATCSTFFKKLWVLQQQFDAQVIPLVFFLLPGAKTEVYARDFKIVWNALSSLSANKLPSSTHTTKANPSLWYFSTGHLRSTQGSPYQKDLAGGERGGANQ
ncbi:hypothetical protein DSO57_1016759 [Entomophthora muscae]|uniref:Uncharacterized protein n=1 Tax=Entomophthora muscae TaxID=34485 RepID=A0ACC2SHH7_9FUNG|nr:hypothetical protein DSO57_1016759 [Entomophthora muscae]